MMKKNRAAISFLTFVCYLFLQLMGCNRSTQKEQQLFEEKSASTTTKDTVYTDQKTTGKFCFPFLSDSKSGQWSVAFYDLDDDTLVFEFQSERALLPASVQKLLTTGAALKILGKDSFFKTEIYHDGIIDKKNRVLNGNLIIIGNHDPSLGRFYFRDSTSSEMVKAAEFLKNKIGIDRISGKIICPQQKDDAFSYPAGWEYDDLSTYYAPLISPLSFAGNVVNVKTSGDSTTVFPPYPLRICRDTVSLPTSAFRLIPFSDSLIISSNFKNPLAEQVPVAKPSLLFTIVFTEILAKNKISIDNQELPSGDKKLLTTLNGANVGELIVRANTNSDNFYAEQLFYKTVEKFARDSLDKTSAMRYADERAAAAKKMYNSCFGLTDFAVTDGCGLSRRNFISAANLVKVLKSMEQDADFSVYLSSLSTPGREGTLRKKLLSDQFADKVFAKTGSMTGVGNLAGYMITASNHRLAFAVLNNYNFYSRAETNQKIEELLTVISLR